MVFDTEGSVVINSKTDFSMSVLKIKQFTMKLRWLQQLHMFCVISQITKQVVTKVFTVSCI